jgi:hypothetical protein
LIQEPWNALKPGEHMHSRTTFNKLTAHMMSLKNLYIWCFYVFVILGLPFLCFAQELEPRRWSHLPTGKNFVGGGYSYTKADIFLDPVLRIEDVEMEIHTWAFKYIRTFELLQKSTRVDFIQGHQEGRWTGLVNGVPSSIKRSGLSDSVLRFAINLYGAPPLEVLIVRLFGLNFPDYFERFERVSYSMDWGLDCLTAPIVFSLKYFGRRSSDMLGSDGCRLLTGSSDQRSPCQMIGFSQ